MGGLWGVVSGRSSHDFASVARASGVGRCEFCGLEWEVAEKCKNKYISALFMC